MKGCCYQLAQDSNKEQTSHQRGSVLHVFFLCRLQSLVFFSYLKIGVTDMEIAALL